MPHAPLVCYYSSANPHSGYTAAVRGYGEKLAAKLGYEPQCVESPSHLPNVVPEVSIGLEDAIWPSLRPRHELKARPYEDQHGQGPSMHALTEAMFDAQPTMGEGRTALVAVSNPHWLVTEAESWVEKLTRWGTLNQFDQLFITNSPRTNSLLWEGLVAALPSHHSIILNDCRGGANEYLAMLAAADAVCLLGSSRSMAGEAAMTGAPIVLVGDEPEGEAAFFQSANQQMGKEAKRFQHFSLAAPISCERYEAYDVTERYVQLAYEQIEALKDDISSDVA